LKARKKNIWEVKEFGLEVRFRAQVLIKKKCGRDCKGGEAGHWTEREQRVKEASGAERRNPEKPGFCGAKSHPKFKKLFC